MEQIVINRTNFMRALSAGTFSEYIIHVVVDRHSIIARNSNGTEFILGTTASETRTWSNITKPAEFLRDCGIETFTVHYTKASS